MSTPTRRALLGAGLFIGLGAVREGPMPQQWNGGHPESLDPTWDLLTETQVTTRKSGALRLLRGP